MARTANVQELAEAMKAQSVTANWDVVVSYTTEKLNKVLQNVWVQGYGSEMPDSVEIKPMTGANQSANEYSMKLHNPTLSFVPGDSAVALLKMGLSGTAWIDGNKADAVQIVMGTFEIELQVPLVSVPDGAQMSGDTIPDMQKSDTKVQFNNDTTVSRNIIFHFRSVDKQWKLATMDRLAATQLPATIDMTMVANELLQTRFYNTVKDVDYKLIQVNNKPIYVPGADTESMVTLRPKSFVFASHGTDKDAVLSVYIQTVESGFGPGDTNPKFPITSANPDLVYRPVPAEYDAAVTIRHEVMRDLFFLKNLNACLPRVDGMGAAAIDTRASNEDGFRFSIRLDREYVKPVWKLEGFALDYGGQLWGKLTDSPLTLRVQNGQAIWYLDYWQRKIRWYNMITVGLGRNRNEQGLVDAHAEVNVSQPILTNKTDTLSTASYSFSADSIKLDVIPQADDREPESFVEKLFPSSRDAWTMNLPDNFKGYKVVFKKGEGFVINFAGLDYFLTKNVFALENKEQSAVKIDTDRGLLTPHDVMLVGKIA